MIRALLVVAALAPSAFADRLPDPPDAPTPPDASSPDASPGGEPPAERDTAISDDTRDVRRDRFHGSIGGGGALLLTGAQGDRWRADLAFDLKPWPRYGILLAARAFDDARKGLVLGGVIFEAAAARPRLVLDLHASLGLDLEARAPAGGGGIRTTLTIYKLLGLAFDLGAYLVVDGFDETRLQIQSTTAFVLRW